jgi:hypothetical protein
MVVVFAVSAAMAAPDTEDLVARLAALHSPASFVLVGTDDAAVRPLLERLSERADLHLQVAPLLPQASAADSLAGQVARSWIACGILVQAAGDGWNLSPIGACSNALPASPPAPTGPVAAATPAIPNTPAASGPEPAPLPAPAADALLDRVLAAKDAAGRRALLAGELATLTDPDAIARASSGLAVVNALDRTHRTDHSVVKLFLTAAMAPDAALRHSAVEAANAGGDPPVSGAPAASIAVNPAAVNPPPANPTPLENPLPPTDAPPHVALPATLQEYRNRHLTRGTLTATSLSVTSIGRMTTASSTTLVAWTVYDGGGAPFTTRSFASHVGDHAVLQRLDLERARSRRITIGCGVAAAMSIPFQIYYLHIASIAPIAAPQSDAAFAGWVTAFGLLATSGTVAITVPLYVQRHQQFVHNYYSPATADRWITTYNAGLRTELGLDDADTADIDQR